MAEDGADVMRFVHESVRGAVYHGVEPLSAIAAEIGKEVADLIKLNANENVYGTPKEVVEAVQRTEHHVYPDPAQADMRQAVADLHGVDKDTVCCGAGSDDLLDIVIRLIKPEAIIQSSPTFGMYRFLGDIAGSKVIDVKRKDDFSVDEEAICAAVKEHNAKIVFLPSPNNPTGTITSEAQVRRILKEDCILVMDEAYADFCDHTSVPLRKEYPNLMVCRTFSKWAGLAGYRLGYALADAKLVNFMLAIKQPYNVNTAANAAGLAALKHRSSILETVAALRAEKDRLFEELGKLEFLKPIPSEANFVLCEVLGRSAVEVYTQLRKAGIIIRYFGTQGGALSNYIRVSAGRPSDTDALLAVLKTM